MKFKEALSKKALQEYGKLEKSIKKGTIEEPEEPDRADYGLESTNPLADLEKFRYMEDIKTYQKEKNLGHY
jgi:hypothetical protein